MGIRAARAEVALLLVPTLIIAANRMEETHYFGLDDIHLRLDSQASDEAIRESFIALADDPGRRRRMRARMEEMDFTSGMKRVIIAYRSLGMRGVSASVHLGEKPSPRNPMLSASPTLRISRKCSPAS